MWNQQKIKMTCLFPLKKLLETDEYATLEELDKFDLADLGRDINSCSSIHSLVLRPLRKSKRGSVTQLEIIQCLISIFDDAIDQIHMLSGGKMSCNAIAEFNKTLEERAKDSLLYDPIYNKVTAEPYKVFFTKEKIRKALTDSSRVNEFLILVRNELKEESVSRSIRTITNKIIKRRFTDQNLLQEEHKNFKTLRNFKHLLGNQNKEIQKSLDEIKNTLHDTEDQTQDLLFENLLREKYVKDWEHARREQNALFCKRAEDELTNMIAKCDKEIDTELRVSNEEELFLLEEETDFENNIKFWTDKLAEESEQRIIQNQILKERRDDLEKMYEDLIAIYEAHKKEMNHYLYTKEQREIAWKEKERRRIAATKIQAWWRGIMVRYKLGPYNPNKKRKKGKKGKKGRKGKKAKK